MLRKILSLLDRRERWKLALLLVLATASGLAQVVGVGSVMPFVSVLTNPETIQENELLRSAHELFGRPGTNAFLMLLGAGVLLASVSSNALIAFTQWYTFRFGRWNQYRLSRRLLEAYLSRPYTYHIQHNSADARKNVLAETQTFTQQLLVPALQAVAYGVSVLLIAAFLVRISPLGAVIAVGIVCGAYGFVYLALRRRLRRVGTNRLNAQRGRFKAVSEALGAIKEIKAADREATFVERYDPEARRFARATATQQVLSRVPRYLVDTVAIASVLLVILLFLATGQNATSILPLVSVYAVAAYRMLPALQHVYLGASQFRANTPVLETLASELSDYSVPVKSLAITHSEPLRRLPFVRAIELRDVSFTYPGRETPALQNVTLTIARGSSLALIGETGAGKTTLADIVLGLVRPEHGELLVDGIVLDDDNLRHWRHCIGYVPQHIYLSDDTVASNIAFGIRHIAIDRAAVERAARIANIHEFIVGDLPEGYDTVVGERGVRLSGGQRQRIGIARALYHDPEVLILDEATSALDSATEAAVQTAIHQVAEAKTLIVIAHRLTTIRECNLVCLMSRGRIVAAGSYDKVAQHNASATVGNDLQRDFMAARTGIGGTEAAGSDDSRRIASALRRASGP